MNCQDWKNFDISVQQRLILETLSHPKCKKQYGPSVTYKKAFLKYVINQVVYMEENTLSNMKF